MTRNGGVRKRQRACSRIAFSLGGRRSRAYVLHSVEKIHTCPGCSGDEPNPGRYASIGAVSMDEQAYAIGQAIFIRTDTADYAEQAVPFRTLEEMVDVCSKRQPNLILEKIVVYSLVEGEPCALTLGFMAATKGQRPDHPELKM